MDQFRQNAILYRGLWIGQIAAGVAGVFLVVAALAMGEVVGAVGIIPAVAFLFLSGLSARSSMGTYRAGLAELEENPVDIASRTDLSKNTERLVFRALRTAKDQFSLIFAYGIIALSLIAVSALLFAFSSEGLVYIVAGSATAVMGVALLYLAVQAVRSWRAAKRLEAQIAEA